MGASQVWATACNGHEMDCSGQADAPNNCVRKTLQGGARIIVHGNADGLLSVSGDIHPGLQTEDFRNGCVL